MGFRDVQCGVHEAENRLIDRSLSNKVSIEKNFLSAGVRGE